ncbi:MAG TPA: GAF domain-containing sensor histidine kinase [Solirubrobacterales bacterium]
MGQASYSGALDEHRLRQLIEVGRGLMAELDPEVVFGRVLEVACELTGARYAALGVLDDDRKELERFITHGIDPEITREIGALPRGRGVLGLLIEQPLPLRLANVGEHPRSYGFPPGHPPMTTFLGVPIVIRGRAWGNLYLTEKEGGEFDEADEQSVLILAEWTAVAIENARLYRNVQEQRDSLKRAVQSLEATTEIARAVGGETDLSRILETIVKRGRALVEARSLLILLEDRGQLRVAAAAGEIDRDTDLRIPIDGSAPGQAMRARRPQRLASIGPDLLAKPNPPDGGAALSVPLVFRGHPVGVLVALDSLGRSGGFTDEDERVLDSFAASAATAVATAQSVAESRMRESIAAAERERGRWARELHDESLQSMAGLRVMLSTARRGAVRDETKEIISQAMERVDIAISEMRRLIADLRPAALDELGLASALEALVERLTWGEVLDVDLEIDLAHEAGRHPTRLLAQTEDTVYRLVQEALNNVHRHANTDRAAVEVREDGDSIRVKVRDEGCGFDLGTETDRFGLLGMRERVTLADGTLTVESSPGAGTEVTAVLPAQHRDDEAHAEKDLGEGKAAEGG